MRFIIDTDLGIDDAVALLMVLTHSEIQIQAITTVMGNVPLAQATHNTGVVLDIAHAPPIPIYQGCERPLLRYQPQYATDVHGDDGLGGAGRAETGRISEAEHAILALIRLVRQYPGEITLLTLGPLTNIALAIRLNPGFLKDIKHLVMMAGAVDGRGNTSPPAEFNIAVDPEAARIVFEACSQAGLQPQLISWETTLAYPVAVADWEEIIAGNTPIAEFAQGMTRYLKQRMKSGQKQHILWPDPLAAAVALAPEIVLSQESRYVEVEIGPNLARGQTIVDYRSRNQHTPNVQIVRELDLRKFRELLQSAMK
jgi:purine nucleosidase